MKLFQDLLKLYEQTVNDVGHWRDGLSFYGCGPFLNQRAADIREFLRKQGYRIFHDGDGWILSFDRELAESLGVPEAYWPET